VASLSSNRSKKVTIRTLRVRGVALEDLHNSRCDELDPENMEDGDYMKKGDLAATLVRSGNRICMAVLEVTGFQFLKEKVARTIAALDDLENPDKQIKISGQIIDLHNSSHSSWEWTKNYLSLNSNSQDKKLTRHQFVLEIPSCLAHPLAASIAAKPISGSSQDISYYPTWKLASTDLHAVLDSLWESLEPETEKIMGNVELLLTVSNSLPYHDCSNNDALYVENLPECLIPQQKLVSTDKISCFLCGEVINLNKMRNHVGSHILHALRNTKDPKVCHLSSVGENPCGFCGQDNCFTQLKLKKPTGLSIASNCPYHYSGMQYKKAAEFSKSVPCTNVPIHCPLCPTAVSGDPPTIWKYNALYHLISEHSSGSTPPSIPGQLLVQIFITKEEEKALGISEHKTTDWRRQNNIPDSDGIEFGQTRKRSDTVSTAHSDSHDQKRNKLQEIQE